MYQSALLLPLQSIQHSRHQSLRLTLMLPPMGKSIIAAHHRMMHRVRSVVDAMVANVRPVMKHLHRRIRMQLVHKLPMLIQRPAAQHPS